MQERRFELYTVEYEHPNVALKKGSEREHKVLAAFLRMYHFPNNSNFIVRLFP